jgi:hypothetical protein
MVDKKEISSGTVSDSPARSMEPTKTKIPSMNIMDLLNKKIAECEK